MGGARCIQGPHLTPTLMEEKVKMAMGWCGLIDRRGGMAGVKFRFSNVEPVA